MKQSNWVKAYIIDVLPCITLAIYVLAFIYYVAYFSVFNINVTHYLSLVDMLLGIMETLIAFALASMVLIWTILYLSSFYLMAIEAEESVGTKRSDLFRLIKSYYYSFLCFIVKVKNLKMFASFVKRIKNNAKKNREKRIKRKKRIISLKNSNTYHRWDLLSYSIIYMGISYLFYCYITKENTRYGLTDATIGLLCPLLFSLFVAVILGSSKILLTKIIKFFSNISTIGIVEIVFVYYLYAIIIFLSCGIKSAEYCKLSKDVAFDIKTTDGTLFNDSAYCFIENLNEKVFLMERETGNNIILSNEGVVYIKVYNKNEGRNSLIISARNKDNESRKAITE